MSSSREQKKNVSIQRFGRFTFEFNRETHEQCVMDFNGKESKVLSAFICPPGKRAEHHFYLWHSDDGESYRSEYKVLFATEPESCQVRYQLTSRQEDGEDQKWYWQGRNTEPAEWRKFPFVDGPGRDEAKFNELICSDCGEELTCPGCDPATCESCDEVMTECAECASKDDTPDRLIAFDAVRMQEEFSQLDADALQSALLEQVGAFGDPIAPWPSFLRRLLDDVGEDTSSVQLDLSKKADD